MAKLTERFVRTLEARPTEYVVWCELLPGFGCRVRPSGHKSLIAQYRIGGRNSPTRKVTIGSYGKITVDEGRKAATKILARAQLGDDVAAERAQQRTQITVAELCDEYLAKGCDRKKASTLSTDRGRISRHIKPLLGRRSLRDVKRSDVEHFMQEVARGATAIDERLAGKGRSIVTGGKGTATRTVRLLGGIFSYAVSQGYIDANPRAGVRLYPDQKGERFLTPGEIEKLGKALREAETVGLPWRFNDGKNARHRPTQEANCRERISPYVTAAIRLLLLTGARLGEILNLRWSDVDFERGFLNLPDSKTGQKTIILSAAALEIIRHLPRAGEYVIAGSQPHKPRRDLKRPWSRIIERAGLPNLRLHDLRHSYASVGAASGLGLGLVGKLLGHASPATTARYSHFGDDPLRRASDHIASQIAAHLEPNAPATQPKDPGAN